MRKEKDMFELITGVASRDERIRAVLLHGSRANPAVKKDALQDYDIVYLVRDVSLPDFAAAPNWIDIFGERLMLQVPEPGPEAVAGTLVYLMLLGDGERIDLTLSPVSAGGGNDSLTVTLLDKDSALPAYGKSDERDYYVKAPTESEFNECCNEFWWVLQNVSKGIWREEYAYAFNMFHICRAMLEKMLCWYIGTAHGFAVSCGKMGKHFQKYLDGASWEHYLASYSGVGEIWLAVFSACSLFRMAGHHVAAHFGYHYPMEDDANMTAYLHQKPSI